jgi:hypothetical protein
MANNVRVLALCGDESHAYFKSVTSQRSRSAANVIAKADMVIFISGTLFPLGPKTDGASTLTMLGGNFINANQTSKWNKDLRKKFKRLFCTENGRMKNWDVMLFRTGILPFHLRRTIKSRYEEIGVDGELHTKWVIPRKYARPEPILLTPGSCMYEQEARKRVKPVQTRKSGDIDLNLIKHRSTEILIMNWFGCALYDKYEMTTGSKTNAMDVITESIEAEEPSERVKTLVGLLKAIVEQKGEKFIIVTEHLALIRLAVAVNTLSRLLLIYRYARR